MAQSEMDGGAGGFDSFLGNVVKLAGTTLATELNGAVTSSSAEKQSDLTGQEDIQGAPTAPQKAAAGNALAAIDSRTLLIVGGTVLGAVVVYLVASK